MSYGNIPSHLNISISSTWAWGGRVCAGGVSVLNNNWGKTIVLLAPTPRQTCPKIFNITLSYPGSSSASNWKPWDLRGWHSLRVIISSIFTQSAQPLLQMPVLVQTSLKSLQPCLYRSSRRHVPKYQTSIQQVTFFHLNTPTYTNNHSSATRNFRLHWVTGLPQMLCGHKWKWPHRITKQVCIIYTHTVFNYIHDWPTVTFFYCSNSI